MSRPVKFRIKDGVAIVTLAHPPANALTAEVLIGLWDVFSRIADHDTATAALILAEGPVFSAGTDIRNTGDGSGPDLGQVCDLIEACPVPVVASIQGAALAGGAELALAAHYRVAHPDAEIGFPEITLGLVPRDGGTQRLPRLVGAERALDLLIGGRPVGMEAARDMGLIDGVVVGHLATGAFSFAAKVAGQGPRPTRAVRDGLRDPGGFIASVTARRAALSRAPLVAHGRIVDCVEAALLLPFEAGCALERDAADACAAHPQSAALRHVFLAERRTPTRLLAARGEGGAPGRIAGPEGIAVLDRLQQALETAVDRIAETGVPRADIDGALAAYGMARPPFDARPPAGGGAAIARQVNAALVAEGARLVEARMVPRASDIDVLCVHGLGYPRWRGGPMRAAQADGLLRLARDMDGWGRGDPVWSPPALLREAVKYAGGFDAVQVVDAPA